MRLADYLKTKEMSAADFAARLGIRANAVSRYATGARVPRKQHMQAIVAATGGMVRADDFFGIDIPAQASSEAA